MRDRGEQILRLVCLVLAALVLVEICHAVLRLNPLKGVAVPVVPTLVTNVVASATNNIAGGTPGTVPARTNETLKLAGAMPGVPTNGVTANSVVNSNSVTMTNHPSMNTNGTPNASSAGTNMVLKLAGAVPGAPTNAISTNIVANTNAAAGTNSIATNNVTANAATAAHKRHSPRMMGGGMGGMMGMSGGSAVALPPLIQARVDLIVSSEIFAPVMHPQPMALLGIAGDTIFLRTDSGQSGLVKVGDSLGNVKLLRIGINRALVEQDGQKKELTIFDGYGSDSLLSTKDESSK